MDEIPPHHRGRGSRGQGPAADRMLPLVYDELRALAARYLSHERSDHTLQPTALVNEAWLRLGDRVAVDRQHFLALGAQAMHRVLIDHARRQRAEKRGGGRWERVTLSEPLRPEGTPAVELLAFQEVLERLASRDPRGARVVELRFFGGLTLEETAGVLGVSVATVSNDWFAARAWLARELLDRGGA